MATRKFNTKRFARDGKSYIAHYADDKLTRLTNETTGADIPSTTKSFRRLADGNRGNKFKAAQ